jgi:SAM-dependent methyltransferase
LGKTVMMLRDPRDIVTALLQFSEARALRTHFDAPDKPVATIVHSSLRASAQEQLRESSLMSLAGSGQTALDIGVRDGHYSRLLQTRYAHVTALDLVKPNIPGCENIGADVRSMPFPDRSFDLVFCAEVLEHVPNVERAAAEIVRITRGRAVIGVPYRQDIRSGRVTCRACGKTAPPCGHINTFDECRIEELFDGLKLERIELAGDPVRDRTTALAAALMDWAGNPWGTYFQEERCECGARYAPPDRTVLQKVAGKVAYSLNAATRKLTPPHPIWMHALFQAV